MIAWMAGAAGILLILVPPLLVLDVIRSPERPRRWAALIRVAESWERIGFDKEFITRGYLVYVSALPLLGCAVLLGAASLAGVGSEGELALWTVGFIFAWALTLAVAVIVVRTGRPTALIPRPFRSTATSTDAP